MSTKPKIAPVDVEAETQTASGAAATEATTAVAERPSAVPALTGDIVSGEMQASDIVFPTVKVIQKMSNNPENLPLGTLTLDESLVLADVGEKINVLILSFEKYYKEVMPFGAGVPNIFSSIAEAQAAGFKLARNKADRESGEPIVDSAVRALVAFEKPEGRMDRSFPLEAGGLRFAPARWFIENSAYRSIAKVVFSKIAFLLRTGEARKKAKWAVTTSVIDGKSGKYAVPNIALLDEEYPDGVFDELTGILQG